MEHSFRIALWMFLLVGYLQAYPVDSSCFMDLNDLGFDILLDVSCEKNVTFTSPAMQQNTECHTTSLKIFTEGLQLAKAKCNKSFHIDQTLQALDLDCLPQTNKMCDLTMIVHESFGSFLNATKTFVEQFNDSQSKK